jgi:hypothetical protein
MIHRVQRAKDRSEAVLDGKVMPTHDEGQHPCTRYRTLTRPIAIRTVEALDRLRRLDRLFERAADRYLFFVTGIITSPYCVLAQQYHPRFGNGP